MNVSHTLIHFMDSLMTLIQYLSAAEDGAILLHDSLHVEPYLRGWCATRSVAEFVQPRQRHVGRIFRQLRLCVSGSQQFRAPLSCGPTKNDQVNQRIRAEPVSAVH